MASRINDYDRCNRLKISRRDFLNGVLIGAGFSLISPHTALSAQTNVSDGLDAAWYGFGGIGDYADANITLKANYIFRFYCVVR